MANGESCRHCGSQESIHDFGEATLPNGDPCAGFEGEIRHAEGCPVFGCSGNCANTIAETEAEEAASVRRMERLHPH